MHKEVAVGEFISLTKTMLSTVWRIVRARLAPGGRVCIGSGCQVTCIARCHPYARQGIAGARQPLQLNEMTCPVTVWCHKVILLDPAQSSHTVGAKSYDDDVDSQLLQNPTTGK